MKRKKGFTLIELISVIVILAVILVIAIPQVISTIQTSRLKSIESSAKMIAKNAEEYYIAKQTLDPNYTASSVECTTVAKLSDDYDLNTCSIKFDGKGKATVSLKGATGKKFNGMTCIGTRDNMRCAADGVLPVTYIYVTYDANGGTISDDITREIGYYEDGNGYKSDVEYIVPERDNYAFIGWYKDSELTERFELDENNIPEEVTSITVYAKWFDITNYIARVNNYEYRGDDRFYDTLQHAIDVVLDDGNKKTIILLKNTQENITIASGQNIELDLNKFTLSKNSGKLIVNNGTLEIKNGTATSTANYPTITNNSGATLVISSGNYSASNQNVIKSYGTATITGGTITSTAPLAGAIDIESGGNVTISGGLIDVTGDRQAVYNNGGTGLITGTAQLHNETTERACVQNHIGIMNITGGTIISDQHSALYNEATATIGIDDGVINTTSPILQGARYGIEVSEGKTVSFYDGIIKGKGTGYAIYGTDNTTALHNAGTVLAYSSEVIGNDTYEVVYLERPTINYTVTFDANGGNPSFSSKTVGEGEMVRDFPTLEGRFGYSLVGWFDEDNNPVDESTIITKDVTFTASWNEVTQVARIDDYSYVGDTRYYETLQDAVSAVATNNQKKVITLLQDITENILVVYNQNIEFDLQTYTISADSGDIIINRGTITIKNGKLIRTGTNDQKRVIDNTGTVYITGGEIKAESYQAIRNYGTMYISGGKIWVASKVDQGLINNEVKTTTSGTYTGRLFVSGGELIAGKRQVIYNNGGTTEISGNVDISNQTNSTRACVQNNAGTLNITGGTIESKTANYPAVLNNDIMTIGVNNSTIDTTTPVIKGEGYGLTINDGMTVTFYDGIIKGKNDTAIDNELRVVTDIINGVTIGHGTDGSYNTAFPHVSN